MEGDGKRALGRKGRPPQSTDIRETGLNSLLRPVRPGAGKTSARPGKHRGVKDAVGVGLLHNICGVGACFTTSKVGDDQM